MLLPVLIPESFSFYASEETDEALFLALKQDPNYLLFFKIVCEDETWSLSHKEFFQKMLVWVSELFLEEKLQRPLIEGIIRGLQTHFSGLNAIIPKNLTIHFKETSCQVNSLLAAFLSDVFLFEIKESCDEEGSGSIHLPEKISLDEVELFVLYVERGDTQSLFKLSPEKLLDFQAFSFRLHLEGLEEGIARTIKRYIDETNVLFYLNLSLTGDFKFLANTCCEVIDRLDWGYSVRKKTKLQVKFERFSDEAHHFFHEFKKEIEAISVSNFLSEAPFFRELMKGCPKLEFLGLSGTRNLTPYLGDVPETLKGLDLSLSFWLNDKILTDIVKRFPHLESLSLASNQQLGAAGFRSLFELKKLTRLDISQLSQVKDDELRLIIKAAPLLEEFNLFECRGISDVGFYDLARGYSHLIELDVGRTLMTSPCLIELAEHNRYMQRLGVERVESLTFKGLHDTLVQLQFLKSINLKGCRLSEKERGELINTFVKVHFEGIN